MTSVTSDVGVSLTYAYDADGNLLTKTDARSITATHSYDALHRLSGKTYSNGDPAISYFYDQSSYNGLTIANGKGRRTGMADAAGTEAWSYDEMARVVADRRTTNGVTKQFSYEYNDDGSLWKLTYPSTRVIEHQPTAAGRTEWAKDIANGINYATEAKYSPAGALCSLKNGSSIVSTYTFNNRLQPNRVHVTTSGYPATPCDAPIQTANILDFTYGFNLGVANNGNVMSIANNRNPDRSQSFNYDELNRIKSAETQANTGQYCWGQCFGENCGGTYISGYDIWANLKKITVMKCNPPMLDLSISTTNRITNPGFSYDAAGNLLSDGSFSYAYDAENRMRTGAGVNYTYDGDGKRVQKSNGKLYWYGMGTNPLAESDANGNITDEFIFFGGKRVARRKSSGEINYYFTDHLGSSRVVTSATGQILDDSDFYPFGGERTVVSTSGNSYKFSGQERDAESGTDYFVARQYAYSLGRFVQTDPENASGWLNIDDPQSWNGYSYGRNNPLLNIDPTGSTYCQVITHEDGSQSLGECVSDEEYESDPAKYEGYERVVEDETVVVTPQDDEQSQSGGCGIDLPCHFFVGFGDLVFNQRPSGAVRLGLAVGIGGVLEALSLARSGVSLTQLGVSGTRGLRVAVNVAHATTTGHLTVPIQKVIPAVENAVQSGKFRIVQEGKEILIRGEVLVDGASVSFKGKIIEGVARLNVFDTPRP